MGWSKKKADPISERARALKEEIAALEAQIKRLSQQEQSPHGAPPSNQPNHSQPAQNSQGSANPQTAQPASPAPKFRSSALPHGAAAHAHPVPPQPQAQPREPIFEDVDQKRLQAKNEPVSTPQHYNDLGVRKYDLAALFQRIKNHFRGPSTANPKLVNYLAAGSIQGLRPMRYEKRVARNRVLFITIILLVLLVGIFAFIRGHR